MVELNQDKLKEAYKKSIAKYLNERIKTDEYLAEAIKKPGKTLDGVLKYVKEEARKQAQGNVACIPDEEVYEWAVHYILEDSIDMEAKIEKKAAEKKPVKEAPVVATPKKAPEKKAEKTIAEEIQPLLFG